MRIALGTILGAIVLFVWSALAWMVIPWPGEPLRGFTNEDAVVQTIKANVPRSGNYLLPMEVKRTSGMTDEQYRTAVQNAENRMIQGPMIFASVRLEPMGSMARYMVIGFITDVIAVLLACILRLQTNAASYPARVGFVAGLGILIFVGGHLDEWNWWGFSNAYMLMQFGVIVIGWILAGLVISIFVRGRAAVG